MKKILLNIIYVLLFTFMLQFSYQSIAQAKIETFTGVGEYIMSMKETPEFAQQNAKLYAERDALEQAGVFVSSTSIVENSQLKKDEISTFSAGLLKNVRVIKPEMIPLTGEAQGYIKVKITVEAQIDTDDFNSALQKWQNKDSKDRSKNISKNNSQQKMIYDLQKKVAQLETDLENAKTTQQKTKVQKEKVLIDKEALYIQKIDEADNIHYIKKDYNLAIRLYNEAIEIKPSGAEAYYEIGWIYQYEFQDYNQAVKYYDKAYKLDPNYNDYKNALITLLEDIADEYEEKDNYNQVAKIYSRIIEIDENYSDAYRYRGSAYEDLKNYNQAIIDYTKAIKLNPNDDFSYSGRGRCYKNLKNYVQAIEDLDKAIQLKPNNKYSYKIRGDCYKALGQIEKANADYAKANELGY